MFETIALLGGTIVKQLLQKKGLTGVAAMTDPTVKAILELKAKLAAEAEASGEMTAAEFNAKWDHAEQTALSVGDELAGLIAALKATLPS